MNLLTIPSKLRKNGMLGSARKIYRMVTPYRSREMSKYLHQFENAKGIEIGGPTHWAFGTKGLIPIYLIIDNLDNVNPRSDNVYHNARAGRIYAGRTYRFDERKSAGMQYAVEAADLSMIASDTYDVLLSSHMIEHTSNPIRVLLEWTRIVRLGGFQLIIVPNKELTFDHYRTTTTLQHMIDDFEADRDEGDLTHLNESIELNDYSMMSFDGETFKSRAVKNLETRCLHHHTFTLHSLRQLLEYMNLDIIELVAEPAYHLIALVRSSVDRTLPAEKGQLSVVLPTREVHLLDANAASLLD
jgi:predicted SAM-dependent methyltransferase